VVGRKGSFMVDERLFMKHGFEIVDSALPDFKLLVKKFNKSVPNLKFKSNWGQRLTKYQNGLSIISSDQCPYRVKNVKEINETAINEFKIKSNIFTLKDCKQAQNSLCPFGTFCIVYNGRVIAEHPVSNGRFKNIMKKSINRINV
jgi:hypothetical protein